MMLIFINFINMNYEHDRCRVLPVVVSLLVRMMHDTHIYAIHTYDDTLFHCTGSSLVSSDGSHNYNIHKYDRSNLVVIPGNLW